jgi:tRNA threonylcarbamoyladenosine biosynthesis protein TsaE
MELDLKLPDEAATLALGGTLAAGAIEGRTLYLRGELGTGKTTLARGLLRALGYRGRVKSPTYSLVEPYTISRLHLYHFDLFRVKDEEEWSSLGFREYFNPHSLCIVEWPERAGAALPLADVEARLEFAGDGRLATLAAHSAAGEDWLSRLPASPS